MLEFAKREGELGIKCNTCMWNGIGGLKARAYKFKDPMFQTLDHFEAKE